MKFKIVSIENKETQFGMISFKTIESLCGKYRREISGLRDKNVGDIVDSFHHDCFLRLGRRLRKIGIETKLTGNYPWIYLAEVNGVKVSEIKNSDHGYCIGYLTSPSNLRHKRDCFNKIREIVNQSKSTQINTL